MKPKLVFFLLLSFASVCFAQNNNKKISITGMVADPYNHSVAGAKITIDGIQTGKSTNSKGFYKIKIESTAAKIGIYTRPPAIIEEDINGRTSINFILNDSIAQQIYGQKDLYSDEEINVGYGTQKRKSSTSSVRNIDGSKEKYDQYTSIYDMLRGEVPGISVVGHTVILQGVNSMTLSSEPLFIVDGTPVISIDNISPRLVKSIDVLKGTDASIYGSRGANGVILITLKR